HVAGSFQPDTSNDFDPAIASGSHKNQLTLSNAGGRDIFVVKLDTNRNLLWGRSMGGAGDDSPGGIVLDGAGNVYTTGGFSGTADFDPGSGTFNLTSAGGSDIFISQ